MDKQLWIPLALAAGSSVVLLLGIAIGRALCNMDWEESAGRTWPLHWHAGRWYWVRRVKPGEPVPPTEGRCP